MDQLSSGLSLLLLIVFGISFVIIVVVIIYQQIARSRVDHSVEQSAAGVVLEDPDSIERKILLDDKIEPILPKSKKDDHEIKFR